MTTTFYLVRHAAHDNVGAYLAGRKPGVRLGEAGMAQAQRLGTRMQRESFTEIVASPRERTRQTAEAISAATGVGPVALDDALEEIDFGAWSGKTFEELNKDPAWARWNAERATAATPAGETMAAVQNRVIDAMKRAAGRNAEGALVFVSHADVIRAAVCFHLGLPVEAGDRIEISPASITTLIVGAWGTKLWQLNETIA